MGLALATETVENKLWAEVCMHIWPHSLDVTTMRKPGLGCYMMRAMWSSHPHHLGQQPARCQKSDQGHLRTSSHEPTHQLTVDAQVSLLVII